MAGRDNDTRDYEYSKNVTSKDFITGAVIGGLIGAAAALFLAPKSGRELRDTVTGQAAALKDKTVQMKDTVVEKTSSLSQTVAQQSTNLVDKVKGTGGTQGQDTEQSAQQEQVETEYIPLETPNVPFEELTLADDLEVRDKLEEVKDALDEEENKYKS
jgi:gas vesicle protein